MSTIYSRMHNHNLKTSATRTTMIVKMNMSISTILNKTSPRLPAMINVIMSKISRTIFRLTSLQLSRPKPSRIKWFLMIKMNLTTSMMIMRIRDNMKYLKIVTKSMMMTLILMMQIHLLRRMNCCNSNKIEGRVNSLPKLIWNNKEKCFNRCMAKI